MSEFEIPLTYEYNFKLTFQEDRLLLRGFQNFSAIIDSYLNFDHQLYFYPSSSNSSAISYNLVFGSYNFFVVVIPTVEILSVSCPDGTMTKDYL
jgi:hypothetical protein